jgi:hypothetical protein
MLKMSSKNEKKKKIYQPEKYKDGEEVQCIGNLIEITFACMNKVERTLTCTNEEERILH